MALCQNAMNTNSQIEPVRTSPQRGEAYALTLRHPCSALVDVNTVLSDQQDRIEIWVNEGGAGDDVDR
jgi:hypothetical protein